MSGKDSCIWILFLSEERQRILKSETQHCMPVATMFNLSAAAAAAVAYMYM